MRKVLPWILIACAAVVVLLTAQWPAIRFANIEGPEFMSRLGTLVFLALLLQRTVEVFLTVWRAEESYKNEAAVRRLINEGKAASDPELRKVQEELIEYKGETQRWALPCTLIVGLLLASFGVRVIDPFLEIPAAGGANSPGEGQLWYLHVTDIVLTATLLAGGADRIHKLLDAFRKFMEATAAKAGGTNKT